MRPRAQVLREASSGEEGGEDEEDEESDEDSDGEGGGGAAGALPPGAAGADVGEPLPSEEDDEDGGPDAPSQYELLARRKRANAAANPRRVLRRVWRCGATLTRAARSRKRARLAGGAAAELDLLFAATGRRRNSRAAARRRKTRAKTGAAMVRCAALCSPPLPR